MPSYDRPNRDHRGQRPAASDRRGQQPSGRRQQPSGRGQQSGGDRRRDGYQPREGYQSRGGERSREGYQPREGERSRDGYQRRDRDGYQPRDRERSRDGYQSRVDRAGYQRRERDGYQSRGGERSRDGYQSRGGERSRDGYQSRGGERSREGYQPREGERSRDGYQRRDRDGYQPRDRGYGQDRRPAQGQRDRSDRPRGDYRSGDYRSGDSRGGDSRGGYRSGESRSGDYRSGAARQQPGRPAAAGGRSTSAGGRTSSAGGRAPQRPVARTADRRPRRTAPAPGIAVELASEMPKWRPEPTEPMPNGEGAQRLQKVLAGAGLGSRRACEELIVAGRVEVDGQVAALGDRADPATSVIHVDGARVIVDLEAVYLALNKPAGVVSTMDDEHGRQALADFLDNVPQRVFHVGRLDAESEGLLLLTNDGQLAHRLMHPTFGVPKTYLCEIPGPIPRGVTRQLLSGVELEDGPAKADSVRIVDAVGRSALIEIVIHEGRNHIVRRMLAEVGHPVQRLVRTAIGPVKLGDLRPGRRRHLTRPEIASLFKAVGG